MAALTSGDKSTSIVMAFDQPSLDAEEKSSGRSRSSETRIFSAVEFVASGADGAVAAAVDSSSNNFMDTEETALKGDNRGSKESSRNSNNNSSSNSNRSSNNSSSSGHSVTSPSTARKRLIKYELDKIDSPRDNDLKVEDVSPTSQSKSIKNPLVASFLFTSDATAATTAATTAAATAAAVGVSSSTTTTVMTAATVDGALETSSSFAAAAAAAAAEKRNLPSSPRRQQQQQQVLQRGNSIGRISNRSSGSRSSNHSQSRSQQQQQLRQRATSNDDAASTVSWRSTLELRTNQLHNMSYVVHHPLSAGFLLRFCESQYCSESMSFVIAVDQFRELFELDKQQSWKHQSWRDLDAVHLTAPIATGAGAVASRASSKTLAQLKKEMDDLFAVDCSSNSTSAAAAADNAQLSLESVRTNNDSNSSNIIISSSKRATTAMTELINTELWPSALVSCRRVEQQMRRIWEQYLSSADAGNLEVFIPDAVLQRTLLRMRLVHVYGRDVFQEALLEPVKTIHRDIGPRFIRSADMKELRERMEDLSEPVCSNCLRIQKPPNSLREKFTAADLQRADFRFCLEDAMEDKLLFTHFTSYLTRAVAAENLRFLRCLRLFKAEMRKADDSSLQREARSSCRERGYQWAWTLLEYFILPDAPLEVSVQQQQRRAIFRRMASPTARMFDELEKSTVQLLRTHFDAFQRDKSYAALMEEATRCLQLQPTATTAAASGVGASRKEKRPAAVARSRSNNSSGGDSSSSQEAAGTFSNAGSWKRGLSCFGI